MRDKNFARTISVLPLHAIPSPKTPGRCTMYRFFILVIVSNICLKRKSYDSVSGKCKARIVYTRIQSNLQTGVHQKNRIGSLSLLHPIMTKDIKRLGLSNLIMFIYIIYPIPAINPSSPTKHLDTVCPPSGFRPRKRLLHRRARVWCLWSIAGFQTFPFQQPAADGVPECLGFGVWVKSLSVKCKKIRFDI